MNTKITSLVLCIALIASLAFMSAAVFTVTPTSVDFTKSTKSFTFTVSNANATDSINVEIPTFGTIVDKAGNSITLSQNLSGTQTIANASSITFTVSYATIPTGFGAGIYSTTKSITSGTNTQALTLNFINDFCELGEVNKSDMALTVDINNKGEGEDDDWTVLDNVEVEVEFENSGDEEIEDVILEFALIDKSTGKNVADDLIWESNGNEEADVNDVDEDDDVTFTYQFRVPNDVNDGKYLLMIKAYPDGDEDVKCIDSADGLDKVFYKEVEVSRESDDERQIVLEDITIEPSATTCGNEVIITAKAYNVGTSDQDAIKITLFNKDLGINANEVVEDFKQDDSKTVEFTINTPKTVKQGTYTLNLNVKYDYQKDDDEDDNDDQTFDDEYFDETAEKTKTVILSLQDGCQGSVAKGDVSIDADLSADTPKAIAGKEVIVISTIRNMGTVNTTYKVSVAGVSSWATAEVEPSEIILTSGESKDVEIRLQIDKDADLGTKEFTIKAEYNGASKEQKVSVTIEKSSLMSGGIINHVKTNWFIYTVIIIDIILILAIIIAVRRMLSKDDSD